MLARGGGDPPHGWGDPLPHGAPAHHPPPAVWNKGYQSNFNQIVIGLSS